MYTCCFVHYIPYLESLGSMFIVAVFFARTPQETILLPICLQATYFVHVKPACAPVRSECGDDSGESPPGRASC